MHRYWRELKVIRSLTNVHAEEQCGERDCVIHRPTSHHMRRWVLHWRNDRGIFERICEHGVGHPDPDQFEYWEETNQQFQSVHGCDGCCSPENKYESLD